MHEIGDTASVCSKCGKSRVWKHAKSNGTAWRQYCSPCHTSAGYTARKKRITAFKEHLKHRSQNEPLFRAYIVWKRAKDRARTKGISFSLPRHVVENAILAGCCQVTGLKFDLITTSKRLGALAPSIDRKNPNEGYTLENSQIVCWLYNRAKGDGTHEDVLSLVRALHIVVC